jgi:membrane protein DedA with SNARE-associated domain
LQSVAVAVLANQLSKWLLRLGGVGLIVIGLVDNSVVPIPGGMDHFVILLTARNRGLWLYYALMAVAGAMIGGFLTYRIARKGGKESFEKKVSKRRSEKVYKRFEKSGFSTVLVGSILPPPFPMVPVLMAAGVLQYPYRKFLTALGIGRAIRFIALAYLGRLYGTAIVGWLSRYYRPFLYVLIAAAVLGSAAALIYFKWYRHREQASA